MAAFDLFNEGVLLVDRYARIFNVQQLARDPLSGLVDGSNTVFYSTYSPILTSGSVGIYLNNVLQSASGYSVDHTPGAFIFNTAPSVQPQATYKTARYNADIIKGILVSGFDEMELRWYRGLSLSETEGTGQIVLADQDSVNGYIVNSSGSNPPIGDKFFSTSNVQLAFYARCTQVAFYQILLGEHAVASFLWQEAQGLKVDKSMIAKNLKLALDALEKKMDKYLEQAMIEWEGTDVYGGAILDPVTREFAAHRFWQSPSKTEDWRNTTLYTGDQY